jgi:hypothetical protein
LNIDGEKSPNDRHFTLFYSQSQEKNEDSPIGIEIAITQPDETASQELICEGYEGLAEYSK